MQPVWDGQGAPAPQGVPSRCVLLPSPLPERMAASVSWSQDLGCLDARGAEAPGGMDPWKPQMPRRPDMVPHGCQPQDGHRQSFGLSYPSTERQPHFPHCVLWREQDTNLYSAHPTISNFLSTLEKGEELGQGWTEGPFPVISLPHRGEKPQRVGWGWARYWRKGIQDGGAMSDPTQGLS